MNRTTFKDGTDPEILTMALEFNGYEVTTYGRRISFFRSLADRGQFVNGVFTATEAVDINAIKREYALESVKRSAKSLGWRVVVNAKDRTKLEIRKRS